MFEPSSGLYSASVQENATTDTIVTTVKAVDHDTGPQGDVYYSITGGNEGNAFEIHSTSGVISTNAALDRETFAKYDLIVKAYDGAVAGKEKFTNGKVTINITDINDNSPTFSSIPTPIAAKEDVAVGGVITRIQATDADKGVNAELSYKILSGNSDGYFTIDAATGDLKANKSLNMEAQPLPKINHTLSIEVTDKGTPPKTASISVDVTITPVNEFTPQLSHPSSFNFSIGENVDPGAGIVVFDVNATDGDYGEHGKLTYHIQSGMTSEPCTQIIEKTDWSLYSLFTFIIVKQREFNLWTKELRNSLLC